MLFCEFLNTSVFSYVFRLAPIVQDLEVEVLQEDSANHELAVMTNGVAQKARMMTSVPKTNVIILFQSAKWFNFAFLLFLCVKLFYLVFAYYKF